jgi:hypothetical protein
MVASLPIPQVGKQFLAISFEPSIESPTAYPFQGKQNGKRYHFTGIQLRLRVLFRTFHCIINTAKQSCDKIHGSHELSPFLFGYLFQNREPHDFFQLAPKVS